ncbi:nucleotide sugar dehydrogenase [Pseudovibrio sp. SPO723]|uniref:nucleotide sugar dehydrogenase n=1 Tax=Nesiotobacter zosterae TaxID=392721 RepID=UPI0029C4E462|nr:nucleotide sugar dehydrogenase [Pseudovibrio sp. SPO723]MDX5592848.1 nucleotide sugar dehydrogenase [Pseudovibrio sp. SPO723]
MSLTVSVVGLGYVGLPVACAFANKGFSTIGFDINEARIASLKAGHDVTGSVEPSSLANNRLQLTANPEDLKRANIHIVAVPTPVDQAKRPDLKPLEKAAETVGSQMKRGDIVVFESTVFPGATEEIAVPILEAQSGLKFKVDFEVGYSPERINPGDTEHTFESILKIVSASSEAALNTLSELYGTVVTAGIHRAPSIRVAEAAKVIENTQRDLNIALMNELAMLFNSMGIDTRDVLEGAGTKWNFLPFKPGLVGGHCIGVDPYYLTHKAYELGFSPQVILAGRGTNEGMSRFVAGEIIQGCVRLGRQMPPRITVLGITYKADVPDTRNSKVVDLVRELQKFGADVQIIDPLADPAEVQEEYGLALTLASEAVPADAVVLAVPHSLLLNKETAWASVLPFSAEGRVFVADLHDKLCRKEKPDQVELWRL